MLWFAMILWRTVWSLRILLHIETGILKIE